MVTEIRPISIDIAWSDDGQTAKGASILEAEFHDGNFVKLLPLKPLAKSTVESVQPYAAVFSASALEQLATLIAERDALQATLDSILAHPDVIADRKQKAIEEAKAKRASALEQKQAAEAALADLGEAIPDEVQ